MEAVLANGAYERSNDPVITALNSFPEQVQTPTGLRVQMRQRPGMATFETLGTRAARGAHQKDGLFSNAAVFVMGTEAYLLESGGTSTLLAGSVAGTSLVDIDSGLDADLASLARVATGSALYRILGSAVTAEDFPEAGGAGASSVCFHSSFWFATEAGTDKVYFQGPGSSTWDPLDFASAEAQPDPLVAVRSVGDLLALLGSSTFEAWTVGSGTPAPAGGLAFKIGCRSRDAAVVCGDSLVFVDNQGCVRRWEGGGTLDIVSDAGLAEQIAATPAMDLNAWYFANGPHRFYVLHLGFDATWVYCLDGAADRWVKWESPEESFWRAKVGCNIGDTVLAGDAVTSQVWSLDPARRTDGDEVFPWEGTAIIPPTETALPVANLVFDCEVGDAPRSGQGSEPLLMVKWSDDGGKTFTNWFYLPMGATGEYKRLPRRNACGRVPAHRGRFIRYRISDPVGRVMRRVLYNVAG